MSGRSAIAARGYHVEYRGNGSDRCPACGRQQFLIGRLTAECVFCGTAIVLCQALQTGTGGTIKVRRGGGSWGPPPVRMAA